MHTREKYSNPLWNGRKRLHNVQNSSLGKDLVRMDRKGQMNGFRLRFVHDLADHGIYIQRNQRSPRQFVAVVPPSAL